LAAAQAAEPLTLLSLPPELLVAVLQWLSPHELARVERVARAFRGPPPPPSLVEQALRQRAIERGADVPAALPAGEASWVQCLSWRDRLAALPNTKLLAAGNNHTVFVDAAGQLLTSGQVQDDENEERGVLGHGRDVWKLDVPTPVSSLTGTRVTCVSAGDDPTLVTTEAGVAHSFGSGMSGQLGHGDMENQPTPKAIEAVRGERVKSV
jgi:hypothetical protein